MKKAIKLLVFSLFFAQSTIAQGTFGEPATQEKPTVVGNQQTTLQQQQQVNTQYSQLGGANTQVSITVDTIQGESKLIQNPIGTGPKPVYNEVMTGFLWEERPWAKAIYNNNWTPEMQRKYPNIRAAVIDVDYFGRFVKGEAAPWNGNTIRRKAGTKVCLDVSTGEWFDAQCGNKYDEFIPWVQYIETTKYVTITRTVVREVPGETIVVHDGGNQKETIVLHDPVEGEEKAEKKGNGFLKGFLVGNLTGAGLGLGAGYLAWGKNTPTVSVVPTPLPTTSPVGGSDFNGWIPVGGSNYP